MSNYCGLYKNDTAAGAGICVSIYFSGCHFHCEGCHNPETWDFNYGKPFNEDTIDEIIEALYANGINRNLCILGGEPLCEENIRWTALLVQKVRIDAEKRGAHPIIYLWTGYENLITEDINFDKNPREFILCSDILRYIDIAITGPFILKKRDITLKWRGSSNQKIIHFYNYKLNFISVEETDENATALMQLHLYNFKDDNDFINRTAEARGNK